MRPIKCVVAGGSYWGYMEQVGRALENLGCTSVLIPCNRIDRNRNFRKHFLYVQLPRVGIPYFLDNVWAKPRQKFMKQLLQHEFDLLILLWPEFLTTEMLIEIRQNRPYALLTFWLMDPLARMPDMANILPLFDHIFTYNADDLGALRQFTPNAHTLLIGYDAQQYTPLPSPFPAPSRWKFSFVGGITAWRLQVLEQLCHYFALTPAEIRLYAGQFTWHQHYRLWRNTNRSWLYHRNLITHQNANARQVCQLYQESAICLNIHQSKSERGYNARIFEIAGAGGFQLVDRMPGLEELFEEGSELVMYDSVEDLMDKATYYLAHPQVRQAIAQRGHQRAAAHHTFRHRAETILSLCGVTVG